MQFFQYFPAIDYVTTESTSGVTQRVTRRIPNMTVKLTLSVLDDSSVAFETYTIADGDRPDTVAAKMYGNARYAWVVMLANNMKDWYDWPLTDAEFYAYLSSKYESYQGAGDGYTVAKEAVYQRIWITEDARELVVDETTYDTLSPAQRRIDTIYDKEYAENDRKRNIRLVSLSSLPDVVKQFQEAVSR